MQIRPPSSSITSVFVMDLLCIKSLDTLGIHNYTDYSIILFVFIITQRRIKPVFIHKTIDLEELVTKWYVVVFLHVVTNFEMVTRLPAKVGGSCSFSGLVTAYPRSRCFSGFHSLVHPLCLIWKHVKQIEGPSFSLQTQF